MPGLARWRPTPWRAAAVGSCPSAEAEGLVWVDWSGPGSPAARSSSEHPDIRWVHLPGAGIESFIDAGLMADGRIVDLQQGRALRRSSPSTPSPWPWPGCTRCPPRPGRRRGRRTRVTALAGQPVTIVGGGGIATVAGAASWLPSTRPSPWCGAAPSRSPGAAAHPRAPTPLHEALPEARLVILALALTPETRHIIGAPELDAMHERAWLVNVSRGGHVDTDALVDALERDAIAGAALDVTDPEPLPDGHRLWSLANCIITPHNAGQLGCGHARCSPPGSTTTWHGSAAGEPLLGVVDLVAGY